MTQDMLGGEEDRSNKLEMAKRALEGDNQRLTVVVRERETEIKVRP